MNMGRWRAINSSPVERRCIRFGVAGCQPSHCRSGPVGGVGADAQRWWSDSRRRASRGRGAGSSARAWSTRGPHELLEVPAFLVGGLFNERERADRTAAGWSGSTSQWRRTATPAAAVRTAPSWSLMPATRWLAWRCRTCWPTTVGYCRPGSVRTGVLPPRPDRPGPRTGRSGASDGARGPTDEAVDSCPEYPPAMFPELSAQVRVPGERRPGHMDVVDLR